MKDEVKLAIVALANAELPDRKTIYDRVDWEVLEDASYKDE